MSTFIKTFIALSALTLGFTSMSGAAADSEVDVQPVLDINTGEPVDGTATLTRTDSGVGFTINTRGLQAGGTYTVWWSGFNHPEECENKCACGSPADFNGNSAAAGASTFWATGRVADKYGQATFAATVAYGEFPDETFYPRGIDSAHAEVQLFIRGHGRPIPKLLEEQLTTFGGGCDIRNCFEPQFVIFPSPTCVDDNNGD